MEAEGLSRLFADRVNKGMASELNQHINYVRSLEKGLDFFHVSAEKKKMILKAAANEVADFFGGESPKTRWQYLRVIEQDGQNLGLIKVLNRGGHAYFELLFEFQSDQGDTNIILSDVIMVSAALRYSQSLAIDLFNTAPEEVNREMGLNHGQILLTKAFYEISTREQYEWAAGKFLSEGPTTQADPVGIPQNPTVLK